MEIITEKGYNTQKACSGYSGKEWLAGPTP
jgi:hypothetical protein